jgi:hypothetical protein
MTTRTHRTENCRGVDARSRRKDLLAVGFALALAFPGAAHPYTLVQLLALPIERLLELKITSASAGQLVPRGLPARAGQVIGGDHAP